MYYARVVVVVVVVVGTAYVLSDVLGFKGVRIYFKNLCTAGKNVALYALNELIFS